MDLINSNYISANNLADILGVSRATVLKWIQNGTYKAETNAHGESVFNVEELGNKILVEDEGIFGISWKIC